MTDLDLIQIQEALQPGRELGKAIKMARSYMEQHLFVRLGDRLDDLESNYNRMLDFMRRGFKDSKREELRDALCVELYRLVDDMKTQLLVNRKMAFTTAHSRSARMTLQPDDIRQTLEGHVADMAMLGLETEGVTDEAARYFYDRRQTYLSLLFDTILVSPQWSEGFGSFMRELLVSPTIDQQDAQVLVSAVMMACMNVFDLQKWLTLVEVYRTVSDERIRQRAFVGWVFALSDAPTLDIFPELRATVGELCADERTTCELLELQMQVLYCQDTDKDTDTIQKEIIPTLVKNQDFRVTRDGIVEKEEDPMRDILDPGASDRAMEELEQSVERMMAMQRSGSDIYFGGFSQMKRFGFFHNLCNWFTPFYIEHPSLAGVRQKIGDGRFLSVLMETGAFCESDKYSFALAMTTVLDKLPDNIREMLNSAEALSNPFAEDTNMRSPAYIRRMYLQDLYRFFRLNNQRADFRNPFDYEREEGAEFFFCYPVFLDTPLRARAMELSRFLHKRKLYELEETLLSWYEDESDPEYLLLAGYSNLMSGNHREALELLMKARKVQPGNMKVLAGLGRAGLACQEFAIAETCYRQLHEAQPSNKAYALNLCIAMIHTGRAEEAQNQIYRLDLEYPDDANVRRVLGWCLLMQGKYGQAKGVYEWLTTGDPVPEDYQNLGYCHWLEGNVEQALDLFLASMLEPVAQFREDGDLLRRNGISEVDTQLMVDLINRK